MTSRPEVVERERRKRARVNERIADLPNYHEYRDPYTGEPVLVNGFGQHVYPDTEERP